MCGCGIVTWCSGCSCGCAHDTPEGIRKQGEHFALQYEDMRQRALDAFERGAQTAQSYEIKDGWFPFGSFVDYSIPLEFDGISEDGLPKWERPDMDEITRRFQKTALDSYVKGRQSGARDLSDALLTDIYTLDEQYPGRYDWADGWHSALQAVMGLKGFVTLCKHIYDSADICLMCGHDGSQMGS